MAARLFGNFFGSVWIFLALGWLLAGLLMWIGAHMAGLEHVSVGRAVLAAMIASTASWVCITSLSDVLLAGTSAGVFLGLLLSWFIIKKILNTSVERALLVWVFDVFAHLLAGTLGIAAGGFRLDMAHLLR